MQVWVAWRFFLVKGKKPQWGGALSPPPPWVKGLKGLCLRPDCLKFVNSWKKLWLIFKNFEGLTCIDVKLFAKNCKLFRLVLNWFEFFIDNWLEMGKTVEKIWIFLKFFFEIYRNFYRNATSRNFAKLKTDRNFTKQIPILEKVWFFFHR